MLHCMHIVIITILLMDETKLGCTCLPLDTNRTDDICCLEIWPVLCYFIYSACQLSKVFQSYTHLHNYCSTRTTLQNDTAPLHHETIQL